MKKNYDQGPNQEQKQLEDVESLIVANFIHLPGFVYFKDANLKYIGCNQNFAALAGLGSYTDIIGKIDLDLDWPIKLTDQIMIDDQRVLLKEIKTTKDYKLFRKNSADPLYIRIERAPFYNDQNKICGILAIGMDITEQKNQELEVEHDCKFLKDIFYNLPGLIYWKNLNSQYMGFNKNVVQLSGLSKEDLLGKTDFDLNWGQREAESFQRDDQEVINTGIAKVTEHEIPIKRDDGNFIVVKTVKSRLLDEDGKIVGVLAIAVDITEQKILEKKLIAEKEKVENLSQAKTEFIRNMEHDIRTPFTGIYSLSKILEDQETSEENKLMVSAISEAARELLNYCNVILDFSRIESGAMPVLEKKFNMKKLIEGVVALEIPMIKSKGLKMSIQYSSHVPLSFIGDEYRIQRIFVNLVSNAIKFTEKGEITIAVEILKIHSNRECIVRASVADTGIGIPDDKMTIIYEKFNRLSPSNQNKYRGMGLGLSIVKRLITDIQGEIEVKSQIGRGTTFIFTLPLKLPLADDLKLEKDENIG